MEHTIIHCTECERIYTVRKRDDGEFLLTTEDGDCACGNGTFRELAEAAKTESAADVSSSTSTAQ